MHDLASMADMASMIQNLDHAICDRKIEEIETVRKQYMQGLLLPSEYLDCVHSILNK